MALAKIERKEVKKANQKLYNAIADKYEQLDGRRDTCLEIWLSNKLKALRPQASGGQLLDIGTGSGLVPRCACDVFTEIAGIDLSHQILKLNRSVFDHPIVADADYLPFSENRFDMVTCFAVFHHLFDLRLLVGEVARVLRPGGIFYSDHDLDVGFSRLFALPLMLYRIFNNNQKKYQNASREISKEIYLTSEFRDKGVDSLSIVRLFQANGFRVRYQFHWYGLNQITDRAFKYRTYRRGLAPLFSMVATKEGP
jgi:ubiquinone/menaquinone biosynthesis C-methylase UbiE